MAADLLAVVRRAARITDAALCGVSCGRDSLATLDLCKQHFPLVQPYFMYLVPGLSFQERVLRYLERRYGVEIMRLPHWMLGDLFRSGALALPTNARMATPKLTLVEMEAYLRDVTGLEWIVTGERKQDSLQRRGMLSACDSIDGTRRHIYPLSEWTNKDVCAYLKMRRIPMPPDYGLFSRSFGQLHEAELMAIKRAFPDDYARILEVFPLAETIIQRAEFRKARRIDAVPDVSDRAAETV